MTRLMWLLTGMVIGLSLGALVLQLPASAQTYPVMHKVDSITCHKVRVWEDATASCVEGGKKYIKCRKVADVKVTRRNGHEWARCTR